MLLVMTGDLTQLSTNHTHLLCPAQLGLSHLGSRGLPLPSGGFGLAIAAMMLLQY